MAGQAPSIQTDFLAALNAAGDVVYEWDVARDSLTCTGDASAMFQLDDLKKMKSGDLFQGRINSEDLKQRLSAFLAILHLAPTLIANTASAPVTVISFGCMNAATQNSCPMAVPWLCPEFRAQSPIGSALTYGLNILRIMMTSPATLTVSASASARQSTMR